METNTLVISNGTDHPVTVTFPSYGTGYVEFEEINVGTAFITNKPSMRPFQMPEPINTDAQLKAGMGFLILFGLVAAFWYKEMRLMGWKETLKINIAAITLAALMILATWLIVTGLYPQ